MIVLNKEEPVWTPLHTAVAEGNEEEAQRLINNDADINAKERKRGQTPLHFAHLLDRKKMIKLLLDNDADPKIKDSDGHIPSDLAPP